MSGIRPIIINQPLMAGHGLTSEQVNNLLKLANYLAALPEDYDHFDMSDYFSPRGWRSIPLRMARPEMLNVCGTSACAAGHGPAAGIEPEKGQTWYGYVVDKFTGKDDGCIVYSNLFGGDWKFVDNTTKGAALRIYYFLENGGHRLLHYQHRVAFMQIIRKALLTGEQS